MKPCVMSMSLIVVFLVVTVRVFGVYNIEVYAIKSDAETLGIKSELKKLLNSDSRVHVTEKSSEMMSVDVGFGNSTYTLNDWSVGDFPLFLSIDAKKIEETNQLVVATTMFYHGTILDSGIYYQSTGSANQIGNMIKNQIIEKCSLFDSLRVPSIQNIALKADIQKYLIDALEFYKTPVSQGGAGANINNVNMNSLSGYLRFSTVDYSTKKDNTTYTITLAANGLIGIKGTVNSCDENGNYPSVEGTVNLTDSIITFNK